MTVVYLPLQGRIANQKDFTQDSDKYESLINELLTPGDVIYTFLFRYARFFATDLHTRFGEEKSTQGVTMDFTNNNLWAAILTTGFVICACIASMVVELKDQQEKEKKEADEINSSYDTICDQLKLQRKKQLMGIPAANPAELNAYLTEILNENESLRKKYNSVSIEEKEGGAPRLVFDKKDKEETTFEKSVRRFFGPLWSSLGIMTFTYWILYIGSGIFGDFGNFGASNLFGFGFGLSILSGLVYAGISVYNHYQKEQNKALGIPEIADPENARDGIELLNECQFRREFDLNKRKLEADFGVKISPQKKHQDYQALIPPKKVSKRPETLGLTWITAFVGSYIGLQYIAWLIIDITFKTAGVILPGIELVNILGGIGLFIGAGIYSTYKGYEAHKKAQGEPDIIHPVTSPKDLYEERVQQINQLKRELTGKQYNNHVIDAKELEVASSAAITIPDQFKPKNLNTNKEIAKRVGKAFYTFIKSFMTGAMLARCFLVKGSALLLPFAAAALSNPATIGIVVAVSVTFALIKVYQEYQAIKKADEETQQKAEEKINKEYVHGIEMADLQISALKELQKKVIVDVSPTPSEKTAGISKEPPAYQVTPAYTSIPRCA